MHKSELGGGQRAVLSSGHELLWEPKHDTQCLLEFGHNTIVVAIRGTASLKNPLLTFRRGKLLTPL
ncbi:TPA: hypothetical protein ACH3X2_000278 [Trebouxia sp. C0005]